jgi:hypothetical protein
MINTTPNPVLHGLHPYYQPAPPAWTPQTIGWYVLFAIVALSLLWVAIHEIRLWISNRYRREGLRELAMTPPDRLSVLLKRTALAVWPREKVASLSGDAWLKFLNSTAPQNFFHNPPGNCIEEIALQQGDASTEDIQALRALVAQWIRRHRV